MTIIAFSGKARSGKTTAADTICANDTQFMKLSFATPLKQMAMDQFDLTQDDILKNKDKVLEFGPNTMTVRGLLIKLGQMYRAIDPDFWVKQLWKKAETNMKNGWDIVIDDLRFQNEANFLKAQGAKLIRIERPGVKLIDDISEIDLDRYPFEAVVTNDKSIIEYQQAVAQLLKTA